MATTRVTFSTKSGKAATGELALPAGTGKAPAVVLFQEWWGVNDHIRSIAERLAAEGFLTLAPDLFHGVTTKDAAEAGRLMNALDWSVAMDEAAGAVRYLEAHERSNGKVGAIGFCMGGAMTFRTAAEVPELAAAVPFYGVPDPKATRYEQVRAPILAHFASRDGWAKPELAEAVKKQLEAAGKSMELCGYDADHAFFNDTRPEVYSPESARLAWDRTLAFLHLHLG